MARSKIKPILWLFFSVGGTVAALLMPILIFINGFLLPLGGVPSAILSYDRMTHIIHNPLSKLVLLGVFTTVFWHAGHRFYMTLQDLHLSKGGIISMICCYGAALVGTVICLVALFIL